MRYRNLILLFLVPGTERLLDLWVAFFNSRVYPCSFLPMTVGEIDSMLTDNEREDLDKVIASEDREERDLPLLPPSVLHATKKAKGMRKATNE